MMILGMMRYDIFLAKMEKRIVVYDEADISGVNCR